MKVLMLLLLGCTMLFGCKPHSKSTQVVITDNWRDSCQGLNKLDGSLCFAWNVYRQGWEPYRLEAKPGQEVYRLIHQAYLYTPVSISYIQVVIEDNRYAIFQTNTARENKDTVWELYYNKRVESMITETDRFPRLDTLKLALSDLNIWDIPSGSDYDHMGTDGDHYILEASKNGVNKIVVRWSPEFAYSKLGNYTDTVELMKFIKVVKAIQKMD